MKVMYYCINRRCGSNLHVRFRNVFFCSGRIAFFALYATVLDNYSTLAVFLPLSLFIEHYL
jgi:hypothetical protein